MLLSGDYSLLRTLAHYTRATYGEQAHHKKFLGGFFFSIEGRQCLSQEVELSQTRPLVECPSKRNTRFWDTSSISDQDKNKSSYPRQPSQLGRVVQQSTHQRRVPEGQYMHPQYVRQQQSTHQFGDVSLKLSELILPISPICKNVSLECSDPPTPPERVGSRQRQCTHPELPRPHIADLNSIHPLIHSSIRFLNTAPLHFFPAYQAVQWKLETFVSMVWDVILLSMLAITKLAFPSCLVGSCQPSITIKYWDRVESVVIRDR